MRVLITGATGFLGSHICRRLVQNGHAVSILCRPTSDLSELDSQPIERIIGDVTDPSSVSAAVKGKEWVVHAAASLSSWVHDPARQIEVNVGGTRHVVQACRQRGVQRLLHVSSVAAVGIPDDPRRPADEQFPFNLGTTRLTYHLSKRRAEEEVLAGVAQGLDAVIVNPASIFGPYANGYRGAEMLRKVRRLWITPYFVGGLCAAHVQDVVAGVLAALRRGRTGERYILGGENLTFRAAVERAARAMRLRRLPVPVPPPLTAFLAGASEPWARLRKRRPRFTPIVSYCSCRFMYYDSGKAHAELGYAPRDFDAILDECLRLKAC